MKTKRTCQKQLKNILIKFSLFGFISVVIIIIDYFDKLSQGTTFLGRMMNTSLIINIILVTAFLVFFFYLFSGMYLLFFKAKPEIKVEKSTGIGFSASIKISNNEPVDLLNVYVKLIRFSNHPSIWNDIEAMTSIVNNNFFSEGLIEVNRIISRSPVFVKIAQAKVADNFTEILLDKYPINNPLQKKNKNIMSCEYELDFEIIGQFADDNKASILGLYYGKLIHTQTKAHNGYARQDDFNWVKFYKTTLKIDQKMKIEREKLLGFSLPG